MKNLLAAVLLLWVTLPVARAQDQADMAPANPTDQPAARGSRLFVGIVERTNFEINVGDWEQANSHGFYARGGLLFAQQHLYAHLALGIEWFNATQLMGTPVFEVSMAHQRTMAQLAVGANFRLTKWLYYLPHLAFAHSLSTKSNAVAIGQEISFTVDQHRLARLEAQLLSFEFRIGKRVGLPFTAGAITWEKRQYNLNTDEPSIESGLRKEDKLNLYNFNFGFKYYFW